MYLLWQVTVTVFQLTLPVRRKLLEIGKET
jgi:hypothetical protein